MSQYSTNLTDKQWQVIKKFINAQERKRKHHLRDIVNAILYINKTGCQWRILPSHFAQVIPKRWIVERTFSWLENFRRLTIDYELLAETAETMVQVACIQMMLNKYFR